VYFTPKRLKLYLWALLLLELIICLGFRSSIRSGAIDFRLYYTAGYMFRTGDASLLYDYPTEERLQNAVVSPQPVALPFLAPPFTALPFALLSFAPYLRALLLFGIVNLALLALAVRVMRLHLRALTSRWRLTPTLLYLSFLPVGLTLVMGQLSIALLLISCLAFTLLETNQSLLAGVIFSLALMKFQIAIPVALLFILWQRWRFTLGFLSGAVLLSALSSWIIGARNFLLYLHSVFGMSSLAGTPLQSASGLSPRRMANLHGLFFTLTPTNRLATILTLIASIALLAWAARRPPSFPLALLVAMLVSYHLYPCDLTLLLLPIGLLCNRLFADDVAPSTSVPQSWFERHRRQLLFCSLGFFLISPLVIEFIANDLIFLLSLPILGLAFSPQDWSTLSLAPTPPAQLLAEIQPSAT
jgi:hypothetical protein